MAWLQFSNYIFQLLFIRLTRHQELIIDKVEIFEYSLTINGIEPGFRIVESHLSFRYSIQYFVVPFTGWHKPFRFVGKRNFLYLSKTKNNEKYNR